MSVPEMMKAYNTLRQAMVICGWSHLYHKICLHPDDMYAINSHAEDNQRNNYPLCCVIRGILFDQIPELYRILK